MTERVQSAPKMYTYQNLIEMENNNRYSTFGKMMLSTQQTAPKFGFGSASREKQQLVFQGNEQAKLNLVGRLGPGPAYDKTDKYSYPKDPVAVVGTSKRYDLNETSYEYYRRKDIDYQPDQADNVRRTHHPRTVIGIASRFVRSKSQKTPGPQYEVSQEPIKRSNPKYTFGVKRPDSSINRGSTPVIVGPATYNASVNLKTEEPSYSIGKEHRFRGQGLSWDKNQTYDTKQGIGTQYESKKKSQPAYTIGRALRQAPIGHFKSNMVKVSQSIKIPHPKY